MIARTSEPVYVKSNIEANPTSDEGIAALLHTTTASPCVRNRSLCSSCALQALLHEDARGYSSALGRNASADYGADLDLSLLLWYANWIPPSTGRTLGGMYERLQMALEG